MMTDFFHATRIFAFIYQGRASESVAKVVACFTRFHVLQAAISRSLKGLDEVHAIVCKVPVVTIWLRLSAFS
jgi:hypothetical protein